MEHSSNLSPPRGVSGSNAQSPSRASSARRQETEDSELAGRVWAREEDDDAWAPCILTLDGGGIRGYSSLLIMKELMHQVWIWENVLEDEDHSARRDGRRGRSYRARNGSPEALSGAKNTNALPLDLFPLERRRTFDTEEVQSPTTIKNKTEDNDHMQQESTLTDVDHTQEDILSPTDVAPKRVFTENELLPCHYFDFMYGTSTGGLIATILGRLRMSVDDGLELYRKVGDDLFGKRRSNIPLKTKYYHKPLEDAVRAVVRSRCHEHAHCDGNDLYPWGAEVSTSSLMQPMPFNVDMPRVCQSCCLTATHDKNITEAHLLRSYPLYFTEDGPNWTTPYNEGADRLPIWTCTRATSAAPFYFKKVKAELDGEMKFFMDGGIRENNPSGAALSEFHSLYYRKCKKPAVMLSVGTGRADQSRDGFAGTWGPWGRLPFVSKLIEKFAVIQNVLIKYTEGEKQHHWMREYAEGEHTWYKRLNVSDGLQNLPLDDWVKGEWQGHPNTPGGATLTRMEAATTAYFDREYDPMVDSYAPPSTMLRQTAEKLVRQRRAREREGGLRWETFTGKFLPQSKDTANGNAG